LRATNRWQSDLRSILSIISGLPDEIRISQVRYEDLVQAPEETLRRVVRELDIDFSPALLEHQLRSWTASNNSSRNDGWKNISRSINSDSVGSSVHLTLEETDFVEATCWELMSRFNYSINQARIDSFTPQDISVLRTKLAEQEPDEKPQWKNLAEEQKERLQSWSTLFKSI
jgi:hypothetical protein